MRRLVFLFVVTLLCIAQTVKAEELSEPVKPQWEFRCFAPAFQRLIASSDPDKEGTSIRFAQTLIPFIDSGVCAECTEDSCPEVPPLVDVLPVYFSEDLRTAQEEGRHYIPLHATFRYAKTTDSRVIFFKVLFYRGLFDIKTLEMSSD
jgi:hypothetical protein